MPEELSTECEVIFSGKPMTWTCLDEMDKALRRPHRTHPQGILIGRFLCEGCRRRKRLRDMERLRANAETRKIRRRDDG